MDSNMVGTLVHDKDDISIQCGKDLGSKFMRIKISKLALDVTQYSE